MSTRVVWLVSWLPLRNSLRRLFFRDCGAAGQRVRPVVAAVAAIYLLFELANPFLFVSPVAGLLHLRAISAAGLCALPPVILVGILVSDSIDSEVRALLLLRAILPSTSAFLAAKCLVLLIQIVPVTAVAALGVSIFIVGGGVETVLIRTLFASGEALLLCILAIGLASSFTSVEEVPDQLTANGKLWILAGYWLVAPLATGALWCLDMALLGGGPGQLWLPAAMALAAVFAGITAFLTAHGVRR